MEDFDKAIAMATGFQAGHYTFRLTVEDQQGATDSAYLNITVCEGGSAFTQSSQSVFQAGLA